MVHVGQLCAPPGCPECIFAFAIAWAALVGRCPADFIQAFMCPPLGIGLAWAARGAASAAAPITTVFRRTIFSLHAWRGLSTPDYGDFVLIGLLLIMASQTKAVLRATR